MELVQKHIKQDVLDAFLEDRKYEQTIKEEFVRFLVDVLEEEEGEEKEEDYATSVLSFVEEYISYVLIEVQKGFSIAWAKKYADYLVYEGEEKQEEATAIAFEAVSSQDEVLAQKDLLLYANLNNQDQYFVEYFIFLIGMKETIAQPSVINKATLYAQICNEQLASGKTEKFAKYYADLRAEQDLTELACWAEAMEFEHYTQQGKKEEVASRIAYEMSEYIANHCESYEVALMNENVIAHRKEIEQTY